MELLYFILGFIFASYLIPIFDGLSTWFLSWVEVKKIKYAEAANAANIKMRKAMEEDEDDTPKRLIGFCREEDENYNEEEDEEDEV